MAMIPSASFFKKIKLKILPKNRRIYAVVGGTYKGEWLVQVGKTKDQLTFFSLPDKHKYNMSPEIFKEGIKKKVLEVVDVLPKNVYNVCLNEYLYGSKQNNSFDRWKQRHTSSALDGESDGDEVSEFKK